MTRRCTHLHVRPRTGQVGFWEALTTIRNAECIDCGKALVRDLPEFGDAHSPEGVAFHNSPAWRD